MECAFACGSQPIRPVRELMLPAKIQSVRSGQKILEEPFWFEDKS